MFADRAVITVRGGKGGDGCVSFRRAKYIPKGGPDGGNGGDGGSVIAVADPNVHTLLDFKYRREWAAPDGGNGKGKDMTGGNGEDLELRLPEGTLIYELVEESRRLNERRAIRMAELAAQQRPHWMDVGGHEDDDTDTPDTAPATPDADATPADDADAPAVDALADPDEFTDAAGTLTDDQTAETALLADLAGEPRVVIARGGRGGFGNDHFKSSTNQTPRQSTLGEPGELRVLALELKLIADVGFVGLPNAGKSTLLKAATRANPKIAAYPFTTLAPQLGIAELSAERRLVLADIPGLIEGAAEGVGLGHRFLRHVERTAVLVHVIDMEPPDGSDPFENYRTIRRELEAYSPKLADKPELLAINKLDLLGGEDSAQTAADLLRTGLSLPEGRTVHVISAATGAGVPALLEACWRNLQETDARVRVPE